MDFPKNILGRPSPTQGSWRHLFLLPWLSPLLTSRPIFSETAQSIFFLQGLPIRSSSIWVFNHTQESFTQRSASLHTEVTDGSNTRSNKYSAPYCLEIGSLTKWEVHCWLSWLDSELSGSPCLFLPGLAQWMPGFLCEWQGFSSSIVNNSLVKEFSSLVVQQALFLTEPSPQPLIPQPRFKSHQRSKMIFSFNL